MGESGWQVTGLIHELHGRRGEERVARDFWEGSLGGSDCAPLGLGCDLMSR